MRILVCGDRNWSQPEAIERELRQVMLETCSTKHVVIEGEARGADTWGRIVAEKLGLPVEKFPADWKQFGRAAGPIRNQQMLDEGKPDLVLAFHPNLDESKGTRDMVQRARKAGIEVRVFVA